MVGVPATGTKVGLFVAVAVCGWVHGQIVLFETDRSTFWRVSARSSTTSSLPCSAAVCSPAGSARSSAPPSVVSSSG